jgi:hypothetical protein
LVIAGNQARVVPDYTVPPDVSATKFEPGAGLDKATSAAKQAEPVKPDQADVKPEDGRPGTTNPGTTNPGTTNIEAGNPRPRTSSTSPATSLGTGDPQPAVPDAKPPPDATSTGTGK